MTDLCTLLGPWVHRGWVISNSSHIGEQLLRQGAPQEPLNPRSRLLTAGAGIR